MAFKTLRDLYIHSIESFGERPACSMYESDTLTYSDFAQSVDVVQQLLVGAGLNSGDKVALLSNNMPNWSVCYFAVVAAGMTIVPILPDFSGEETDKIIAHADAKALIVSDKLFSKLAKKTIDRLNIVIRSKNLGVISQHNFDQGAITEPKSEDVAAIIYTSGTTSKPKGVMLSHYNLCTQLEMDYDLYPIDTNDVFLSILPLSHTYECTIGMLYPFMMGASVVYLDRPPTASTLMPAMRDVRPTLMLAVPLIIEKIYRSQIAGRFAKNAFLKAIYAFPPFRKLIHRMAGKKLFATFGGRIRFFGIGGAKLDGDTERFMKEGKFPYAIGYGLTETAPLLAGAIPGKVKLQSTGPILKGIKYRLENINPQSGEGELVVLSPSTMVGYYKNPEATKEAFTKDGWFRTKDLGIFDKDGNLSLKGRLNNMILGPSGENIYPEEIENVINGHFLVADSIVKQEKGKLVAMVHFNTEELERKYYDLKEGLGYKMEEIKSELMNYVNSKVNKFSRISIVEEHKAGFEKTPTHKIKRFLYIKKR